MAHEGGYEVVNAFIWHTKDMAMRSCRDGLRVPGREIGWRALSDQVRQLVTHDLADDTLHAAYRPDRESAGDGSSDLGVLRTVEAEEIRGCEGLLRR
jgi:hypothetical protein